MKIAITGTLWDMEDFYRMRQNRTLKKYSKKDYLVVLGRCRVQAPRTKFEDMYDLFKEQPYSVLFLGGDTEDYDFLSEFQIRSWNGGKAQILFHGMIRLCQGYIFNINGKTILAIGGRSTPNREDKDKYYSWWPDQDINGLDMEDAIDYVKEIGGKVDYVFSSDCPYSWKSKGSIETQSSILLDDLKDYIKWDRWFYFDEGNNLEIPNAQCINKDVVELF